MSEHADKNRNAMSTRRARALEPDFYEMEADSIKALAHPKRLQIVDLLSDGSERTVSELQAETRVSQSNVSQNLAILRYAGLLNARRDGNNIYYSVSDPRVLKAVTLLRAVLDRQLGDKQFVAERTAFKTKDRATNATTYAALLGVGLLAAILVGAVTHPLWVGGTFDDVGSHVTLMIDSPTAMSMMETCRDVLTQPRAAAPTEMNAAPA